MRLPHTPPYADRAAIDGRVEDDDFGPAFAFHVIVEGVAITPVDEDGALGNVAIFDPDDDPLDARPLDDTVEVQRP